MNFTSVFDNVNLSSLIEHVNIPIVMDHLNRISQVWPILVYLFIALIVTTIPFLRGYFSLPNTLFRDAIRVILEGRMANNSVTREIHENRNTRFKHTMITYLGYTGESLAAIGLFYLVANQNYHLILYLFIGLLIASIFLGIRRVLGILWALSLVAFMAFPIYFKTESVMMHLSILLVSYFLIHSMMNGLKVFRQTLRKHESPLESGFITRLKLIPATMLSLILLGQSLLSGYFILTNILSLF
jgi:hypothetical protein